MASTYSSSLKLELMETGANANTWGNNTNTNLQTVDAFSAGFLSKSVAGSSNVTLTTNNADPTAESSNKVIDLNGILTGNIHVFIPAVENNYVIYNNTSGAFTVTIAATGHAANGTAITQGEYSYVYCDGASNYNVEKSIFGNPNAALTTGATFTGNVSLNDNVYLNVGTGADLQIYHDGSDSYIADAGTGNLNITSSNTTISGTGETLAKFIDDGAVELYYDNSKKLETVTGGVTVTGTLTATALTETSSIEYKENIKPLSNFEGIYALNAVKYDRKDGSQKGEVGFIAEEMYELLPELVSLKDGKPDSIKYTKLTTYLLEAIKDLKKEIDMLKGNK
jgi:hypothetical protein